LRGTAPECPPVATGLVDGRLLLAVKSLYSVSDVCVRFGGGKSQAYAMGIGLRQGCMPPPLLYIEQAT